jgi:hypothetical protein
VRVVIQSIPHAEQRYDTVGDWITVPEDPTLAIRVSELSDWREMALVALHEFVEAVLCDHMGITSEAVDEFDQKWSGDGEPGDDPAAPYYRQHRIATTIERLIAEQLQVDWDEYGRHIEELS